jgi:2,4-dienoyl-CoA reductase (NADPH2)
VGAGPAGLQAAIAAASRGHDVTVLERDAAAGGQVRIAATVPNRAEFGDLVRNQVAECKRLGVSVSYGVEASAADVRALRPDVVVVATGSSPARPYWVPGNAGADGIAPVADVREVLEGAASPSGRVVVVDELGFHQATSVAEVLADRGCAVEVMTPGMVVGQDLGVTLDLEHWNVRAAAKNITQSTDLVVMGLDASGLQLLHHPTGTNLVRACDWVVLAVPAAPCDALYFELLEAGVEVHRVGDCVAPRRAHAAVIEGDANGASV